MLNKRVQSEIDSYLSKLYSIPEEIRQATASSLTQCREKISFTAFSDVAEKLTNLFYSRYNYKKYFGYRLIAIDGSVYTLPRTKKTKAEFGENVLSGNRKWIKAQVSFAADVLNNICAASTIGPYKQAEDIQAFTLMDKLGKGNLYLFDRGYFGRLFLKRLVKTGCQFCIRLQRNACRELVAFINSNKKDCIEYIEVEGEQIKVRLTKILLNTGEEEYLMSSLFDTKTFTCERLKSLYHLRWGVEELYKDMKYAICVENFIGKSPNSIKQEFYANILTYNLSMMLCKPAIDRESNKGRKKLKYKTNKRALLAKVKQCFVSLFFTAKDVYRILSNIIATVAKESVPIRENRKYIRSETIKAKIKPFRAYVAVV